MIHLRAGSGCMTKLLETPITNDFRYQGAASSVSYLSTGYTLYSAIEKKEYTFSQ